MFTTSEAVNYILNSSKIIVDEINKRKNCPDELKVIQYLIFAGMVAYYGYEYINIIYEAFKSTNFIYTNKKFKDYVKELNYSNSNLDKLLETGDVRAFVEYKFLRETNGEIYTNRDIYIIDSFKEAPDLFLEKVIHEINHVVNSINNYLVLYKGFLCYRTGLYVSCMEQENMNLGLLLEEDYNVLQTAEIMEHILEFTQYDVKDSEIKRELDKIKYAYGFERCGFGYKGTIEVFRNLYNNSQFKYLVKRKRLSGDLKSIILDFDDKCGVGSFYSFCDCLDKLEASGNDFCERKRYEAIAKKIIKKYNSN